MYLFLWLLYKANCVLLYSALVFNSKRCNLRLPYSPIIQKLQSLVIWWLMIYLLHRKGQFSFIFFIWSWNFRADIGTIKAAREHVLEPSGKRLSFRARPVLTPSRRYFLLLLRWLCCLAMAAVKALNPKAEVARAQAALAVNISAARGLQDVLKSNLGPKGTMKMWVPTEPFVQHAC